MGFFDYTVHIHIISGEKPDSDLICCVSQLKYNVQGSEVKGIYIRFLASSSSKVPIFVISSPEHILFDICPFSMSHTNVPIIALY